jgi:hypothetical protein
MAQAIGVSWYRLIYREVIPVILIEPVLRTEPHQSFAVLQNAEDRALREALVKGDAFKFGVSS